METVEVLIKIPKEVYEKIQQVDRIISGRRNGKTIEFALWNGAKNGTPLPEYMKELKRRLLMEVDGGTDDKYLRYADVCDRISSTIDTYVKAES